MVDWNFSSLDIFLSRSYSSPSPRSTVSSLGLFALSGLRVEAFASGSSKICASRCEQTKENVDKQFGHLGVRAWLRGDGLLLGIGLGLGLGEGLRIGGGSRFLLHFREKTQQIGVR